MSLFFDMAYGLALTVEQAIVDGAGNQPHDAVAVFGGLGPPPASCQLLTAGWQMLAVGSPGFSGMIATPTLPIKMATFTVTSYRCITDVMADEGLMIADVDPGAMTADAQVIMADAEGMVRAMTEYRTSPDNGFWQDVNQRIAEWTVSPVETLGGIGGCFLTVQSEVLGYSGMVGT